MFKWGHSVAKWLRHFATNKKVAGSIPDEVNELFSVYLIFPAPLRTGIHSDSTQKHTNKISGE
jgi:hypothetical protein